MPLYWTIDSRKRLVTATAEGRVTVADFVAYFEATAGAGALPYRKLFDGAAADFLMDDHEVLAIGAANKALHQTAVGPLAMVLSDDNARRLARLLGILATARRPMRMFANRRLAQRWLDGFEPAAEEADSSHSTI